jgi:hypothetical protein
LRFKRSNTSQTAPDAPIIQRYADRSHISLRWFEHVDIVWVHVIGADLRDRAGDAD